MARDNVQESIKLPTDVRALLTTLTDLLRKHAYAINGLVADVNALTAATPAPPGTETPTDGTWDQGDFSWHTTPEILGNVGAYYILLGWSNVSGGTPGTWVEANTFIDSTGAGAPSSGAYDQGDFVWNTSPSVTGSTGQKYILLGWSCVTGGVPGIWVGVRPMIEESPGDAPSTGTWATGNFYWNSTPSETGETGSKYVTLGWSCTAGGSPGTWVGVRAFTGN